MHKSIGVETARSVWIIFVDERGQREYIVIMYAADVFLSLPAGYFKQSKFRAL